VVQGLVEVVVARPWAKTARSSPSTWATLTAGRRSMCRALADEPSVLKVQVACRK